MTDKTDLPPITCPLIDSVIEGIRDAESAVKRHERMDEAELRDACSEVETDLSGLEDILEQIRDANSALRNAAEENIGKVGAAMEALA